MTTILADQDLVFTDKTKGNKTSRDVFLKELKKYWKTDARVLIFDSDIYPLLSDDKDDVDINEDIYNNIETSVIKWAVSSGLTISKVNLCRETSPKSYKNDKTKLDELIHWADTMLAIGSDDLSMNRLINDINLKKKIDCFDGLFICIGAGAVNAADDVYIPGAGPNDRESDSFSGKRYKGLGLTTLNFIPDHTTYIEIENGGSIKADLAAASMHRRLYFTDGDSFFVVRRGSASFFGHTAVIEDGKVYNVQTGYTASGTKIGSYGYVIPGSSSLNTIFQVNTRTYGLSFIYFNNLFRENGITDLSVNSYDALMCQISKKLAIDDEKQSLIDQSLLSDVIKHIDKDGVFSITFHTKSGRYSATKSMKIYRQTDMILMGSITDINMILDHDRMTGEYSKDGFIRAAEEVLEKMQGKKKLSLCYSNVKNLKALNDILGSKNGDLIIFSELNALKDLIDPLVIGRLEADHYVFIADDEKLTATNAALLSKRKFMAGAHEYTFDIQLGIYHINGDTSDVNAMIDRARLAEKSITKQALIPVGIFDQKMHDEYIDKQVVIQELEQALKNKEFKAYYQPVVNIETGKIVSAEALVRWQHHSMGIIAPYRFIPTFEETGDISKISRYMLDDVIAFCTKCRNTGKRTVPCAINLSRIDFYDNDFIKYLEHIIADTEDISDMIKIEVTESAYSVLESGSIKLLNRFKEKGVKVLLDDFGSGMSSLSTLESFAFDTIKLDMGFIKKIGISRPTEAIIHSTIDMAHELNAEVIAEGVETQEQNDFLRGAGCDMIQGYLYYKPMQEEEFAAKLQVD